MRWTAQPSRARRRIRAAASSQREALASRLAPSAVLSLLDIAHSARDPKEKRSFLPLRAHLFHRTQPGVWSCCHPECPERQPILKAQGWPWGAVHFHHQTQCRCGSAIFEVVLCHACGEPHLSAREDRSDDYTSRLAPRASEAEDDLLFELQTTDGETPPDDAIYLHRPVADPKRPSEQR